MVLLILGLVVVSDALSDALRRSWLAPAALRRETGRPGVCPPCGWRSRGLASLRAPRAVGSGGHRRRRVVATAIGTLLTRARASD